MRIVVLAAAATVALAAVWSTSPAQALTSKECSEKFQAAKKDGSLGSRKWPEFRKAECGAASPTASNSGPTAQKDATAPAGSVTYPSAIDPKYAKETAGKARMHTCLDAYKAAKASGTLGGMKWIQKGGGYYPACNAHLKA